MKTTDTEVQNIDLIKSNMQNNVGKQIFIREFNKQGKKLKEIQGEIISAYNSLFLVRINIKGNYINKSFSYVDFLTKEFIFEII